jgi:hypothetical protein
MRFFILAFWGCIISSSYAQSLANCETPCCQEYQAMIDACDVDDRLIDHATRCLKSTESYEDCKKQHPEIYGPGFE